MKMEKQKKWLKFKTNVEVNVRPVQRGGGGGGANATPF